MATPADRPLIIGTWSFSQRAAESAWEGLDGGGSALDAVVLASAAAEEDPSVDSVGYGGLPDSEGQMSLDGCVMVAPALGKAGSAVALRSHRHPVRVARWVMERTAHMMLAGDAADRFADACGEPREELLAPAAKAAWEKWRAAGGGVVDQSADRSLGMRPVDGRDGGGGGRLFVEERRWLHHDTIGVLARDRAGTLAGACSTSGTPFKVPGRVGDSPIIGHGLYVDPAAGAAVATGAGELISAVCGSFLVVEEMRRGASPEAAIREALRRIEGSMRLEPHHQVAFIALGRDGEIAGGALRRGFLMSIRDSTGSRTEAPALVLRED